MVCSIDWTKIHRQLNANGPVFMAGKEFSEYALSCDWMTDNSKLFVSTTDGKVHVWDLQNNSTNQIAQHASLVPWCKWIPEKNLLLSASLDRTIKYWDGRQQNPVLSVDLGDPFLAGDLTSNLLVAAAGKNILIYNLNNPQVPYDKRTSPLQHQIRVIRNFPNSSGYIVSSIEGRVAVQHVVANAQKDFIFKCHRDNTTNMVYAINDVSFNNRETFATCSSDGSFNFWDKDNRTKVKGWGACSMPVTCCAFNKASNCFAWALGYDWYQGAQGYNMQEMKPHVFVMRVTPQDIEKKKKS